MNNDILPIILSLVAGVSTVLGCIFIFIKIKRVEEFITISLSLSFIIMLCISLFELLPSSIKTLTSNYGVILGLILSVLVFILGNTTVGKINRKIDAKKASNLYRVGVLSMITLFLHNLPEGIAVYMGSVADINIGYTLFIAIVLHNIPEGIVISVPLYLSNVSRGKIIIYTLLSGLAEPIGAILTYLLLRNYITDILLSYILIFVAGLMINLSVNEILKEALSYKKYKYIVYGCILGLAILIITKLI